MTPLMTLSLVVCALLLLQAEPGSAENLPAKQTGDCVVLLHGLGRTALSMKRLEVCLKNKGFRVINETYPSTSLSIQQLADDWLPNLLKTRIPGSTTTVHFVTHSLGGIVLRQFLSNHDLESLGRVVMIAPPNHGSEIMDRLRSSSVMRCILGPAVCELGTSTNDVPAKLGPIRFECGIIAGDRSLNPFLYRWLTGANDGKVTVESARAPGMQDFIVLHSTHTWLAWRQRTLDQTLHFLKAGAFEHQIFNQERGNPIALSSSRA